MPFLPSLPSVCLEWVTNVFNMQKVAVARGNSLLFLLSVLVRPYAPPEPVGRAWGCTYVVVSYQYGQRSELKRTLFWDLYFGVLVSVHFCSHLRLFLSLGKYIFSSVCAAFGLKVVSFKFWFCVSCWGWLFLLMFWSFCSSSVTKAVIETKLFLFGFKGFSA